MKTKEPVDTCQQSPKRSKKPASSGSGDHRTKPAQSQEKVARSSPRREKKKSKDNAS
jgi:hypothetical protein